MRKLLSYRNLALATLCAGGLVACSQEEPAEAPPKPAAMVPQAKKAAPAKPAFVEPPDTGEPGVLTSFADADEIVGDVPHTVKLDVDIIDNTGNPPFTFVWDFGDATEFSTEKSPTHTYKIPGSFRASVIVKDSKGEVDQDYVDISVNEPLPEGSMTVEQLQEMFPVEEFIRQYQEEQAARAKNGGKNPGKKNPGKNPGKQAQDDVGE